MKYIVYIVVIVSLIGLSCNDEADFQETLLLHNGTAPYNEYWWGVFEADSGDTIEVTFISRWFNEADLLFMDDIGFEGFKQRIDYDVVLHDEWILQLEEFGACTLSINAGDSLRFNVYCPIGDTFWSQVDIFLFDSAGYDTYLQGQPAYSYASFYYTLYVDFIFWAEMTGQYFLVVDNTSIHGSNPVGLAFYWADICEPRADSFDYYEEGSVLNIDSTSYVFEMLEPGECFCVINNAGFVEGGATPVDDVHFSIDIKKQ